jgi:hypothetical protein
LQNTSKDLAQKAQKLYFDRQTDYHSRRKWKNVERGLLLEESQFQTEDDWSSSNPKLAIARNIANMTMSELMEELIEETDKAFGSSENATTTRQETVTEKQKDDHPSNENKCHDEVSRISDTHPAYSPPFKRTEALEGTQQTGTKKMVKLFGRQKAKTSTSRWAKTAIRDVTHNVAGVLSGKVFKLEVVEMPNRKALQPPIIIVERKESFESTASTQTAGRTPTDPFHFEDLTYRIKAAVKVSSDDRTATADASSVPPRQSISKSKSEVLGHIETRFSKKISPTNALKHNGIIDNEVEYPVINSEVPRIKKRRLLRHRLTRSRDKILRSIPESQTAHFSPISFSEPRKLDIPYLSTAQQTSFITLPSTTFTLTAPLFRHGPIRIDRPDPVCPLFSPQDEFMDWTAFQMAILGTMDANGGDPRDDWEWEANEQALEDVILWWESYGFEGFGTLESSSSDKSAYHVENLTDPSTGTYMSIPAKHVNQLTDLAGSHSQLQRTYGRPPNPSFRSNEESAHDAHEQWTTLYAESLPPSPMFNLATPSRDERDSTVPMGYNLGHDLGDFLRWKEKHVQSSIDP